jgi:hypothetical protein
MNEDSHPSPSGFLMMFWPMVLVIQSEHSAAFIQHFIPAWADWFGLLTILDIIGEVFLCESGFYPGSFPRFSSWKFGRPRREFFSIAIFLIICRQNNKMSPGLAQLFASSPFASQSLEFVGRGRCQTRCHDSGLPTVFLCGAFFLRSPNGSRFSVARSWFCG